MREDMIESFLGERVSVWYIIEIIIGVLRGKREWMSCEKSREEGGGLGL